MLDSARRVIATLTEPGIGLLARAIVASLLIDAFGQQTPVALAIVFVLGPGLDLRRRINRQAPVACGTPIFRLTLSAKRPNPTPECRLSSVG
ncbi:hypothetical protein [Frigidibacter sp. SD6-1]|uniref:hypothetical protein n=1 Tax=Frigidibacter sp. SD6-1 TaxID=3032581 RepID=UPI0024DF32F9|nr:hypothetical protein [Frigidibacter sp. SD6-1]